MMNRHSPILASCGFLLLIFAGCMNQKKETIVQAMGEEARHLRNIRQLTFGGENAEAYFSFDDRKLIFQSTRDGRKADQIYTMRVDGNVEDEKKRGGHDAQRDGRRGHARLCGH